MKRFQVVGADPTIYSYNLIDATTGAVLIAGESMTICENVAAHLNGDYTDDLSECYEIAQEIARAL